MLGFRMRPGSVRGGPSLPVPLDEMASRSSPGPFRDIHAESMRPALLPPVRMSLAGLSGRSDIFEYLCIEF